MASAVENAIRGIVTKGITSVAEFNRNRQEVVQDHPFLTGIHTPLHDERTITDLAVTGTIPTELSGRYVRIGPNPYRPDPRGHHWFIGDGMVHGVRLSGGKAEWYRNRYIRSNAVAEAGGPVAAPGPRRENGDTVNTNIIQIAGKTMALVEAGSYPVELSDELESIAYSNFGGGLKGAFTAHPHHDPLTGEFHSITYDATNPGEVFHVTLDAKGNVLREIAIPVEHGPSIHDCTITSRYVVIFDLPVTFSMKALIGGEKFPYHWNPAHRARIGLLPRGGRADEVIWCAVDPCYVFHVAGSFDRPDSKVVVDAAVYATMFEQGADGPNGKSLGFERWVIDPLAGTVERTTIDATPQEFPRPDERKFGQDYRYAWSIGLPANETPGFMGTEPLYRYDLQTGERTAHHFGPTCVPGEFVFVPRNADAPEGDGWMIGYVINVAADTTDLVILDANDMAAQPVAQIHIPHRIPPGFHGNWLADLD
jgi:carotenoid cleavage dioxygenase